MKHETFFYLTFIILVTSNITSAQNMEFSCNPNFHFYHRMWVSSSANKMYDSLNHINFDKEDFELRVWYQSNGQLRLVNNVFIMRHYIKGNKWRAFYYSGFTRESKQKSISEFFSNNELKKYKPKEWKLFWDTLVSNNILTLIPPSQDSLSKIIGGGWFEISHDAQYVFELVKKDCKRSYGFSVGASNIGNFKDVSEFKTFHTLVALLNRRLT